MKKNTKTVFVCQNCGNEFVKWSGQCSACGEWNSLKEVNSSIFKLQFSTKNNNKNIENYCTKYYIRRILNKK